VKVLGAGHVGGFSEVYFVREAPTPERLAEIRRLVYGVENDPQGD